MSSPGTAAAATEEDDKLTFGVDRREEQQATDIAREAAPQTGDEGAVSGARHDGAAAGRARHHLLMRLLLRECWTDGSLIALKTDVFSGVTLAVAQVAPSVAFALMGSGPPLAGLFSSFFLGFICCVFGGRPGQITAIAGAVVVLYPNLVAKHGYGAVCAVSIISGCFILLPGIFRVARLVRLLPSSLMLGFCNGLALSMVVHQVPSFKDPEGNYVTGTRALYTAIICIITYAIMMLLPYFTTFVPSTFIAIVVGTAIEYIFRLGTVTIGDLYKLHGDFPRPQLPSIAWRDSSVIRDVMVSSVLTAVVSCIESFMSDYKIQQLTETPTQFERESLALGVAHIVNGFFQGMPGCVVFGPCILNIECGSGTRRLSALICAVLMVVIPLALYTVIGIIPMGALSAVVFGISSKTADWRMLPMIFLQRISLQESVVALVVTVVTVIENLAIGAACGFGAALLFFMWNMARGRVTMSPAMSTAAPCLAPTPAVPLPPSFALQQQQQLVCADFVGDAGSRAKRTAQRQSSYAIADLTVDVGDDDAAREIDERAAGGSLPQRQLQPASRSQPYLFANGNTASRAVEPTAGWHADGRSLMPYMSPTEAATAAEFIAVEHESPPAAMPNRSIIGNSYAIDFNLLEVEKDATFPEIRVLRIKLRGVLFFGSCMEFVDGMLYLLHKFHSDIFLRVTDFVLDFQHGLMPVVDFSAAEAIQDTGRLLAKRGIRTHLQNMDPLSWTCVERCRRYFPDIEESDVNNVKDVCYVRRVFHVASLHSTHEAAAVALAGTQHGVDGVADNVVATSTHVTLAESSVYDALDEDVFLRANRSIVGAAVHGAGKSDERVAMPPTPDARDCSDKTAAIARHEEPQPPAQRSSSSPLPILQSTETQVAFEDTIKVGFPVYRPAFDIVVPVFDTVSHWTSRMERETAAEGTGGAACTLDLGLTQAKPFNRQLGDVGRLWWARLRNKDVPKTRHGSEGEVGLGWQTHEPARRAAPRTFVQIPRFPGQGYAKHERLHRAEWEMVKANVYRRIFATEPPHEPGRVVARLMRFRNDLVDGFI